MVILGDIRALEETGLIRKLFFHEIYDAGELRSEGLNRRKVRARGRIEIGRMTVVRGLEVLACRLEVLHCLLTRFFSNPFSMNNRSVHMEIQTREQLVLHRLTTFYGNEDRVSRVRSILSGESKISLRLIDWLVTNYAKKYNISFVTKREARHVIVYLAYKSHLKAYSKKMFDPFCRWKRIKFLGMDTTIGQLNFFEWAIQDEVLDYLETHYDAVQADMDGCTTSIQKTSEGSRRKRHELSRSATKAICLHTVPVSVSFA